MGMGKGRELRGSSLYTNAVNDAGGKSTVGTSGSGSLDYIMHQGTPSWGKEGGRGMGSGSVSDAQISVVEQIELFFLRPDLI